MMRGCRGKGRRLRRRGAVRAVRAAAVRESAASDEERRAADMAVGVSRGRFRASVAGWAAGDSGQ